MSLDTNENNILQENLSPKERLTSNDLYQIIIQYGLEDSIDDLIDFVPLFKYDPQELRRICQTIKMNELEEHIQSLTKLSIVYKNDFARFEHLCKMIHNFNLCDDMDAIIGMAPRFANDFNGFIEQCGAIKDIANMRSVNELANLREITKLCGLEAVHLVDIHSVIVQYKLSSMIALLPKLSILYQNDIEKFEYFCSILSNYDIQGKIELLLQFALLYKSDIHNFERICCLIEQYDAKLLLQIYSIHQDDIDAFEEASIKYTSNEIKELSQLPFDYNDPETSLDIIYSILEEQGLVGNIYILKMLSSLYQKDIDKFKQLSLVLAQYPYIDINLVMELSPLYGNDLDKFMRLLSMITKYNITDLYTLSLYFNGYYQYDIDKFERLCQLCYMHAKYHLQDIAKYFRLFNYDIEMVEQSLDILETYIETGYQMSLFTDYLFPLANRTPTGIYQICKILKQYRLLPIPQILITTKEIYQNDITKFEQVCGMLDKYNARSFNLSSHLFSLVDADFDKLERVYDIVSQYGLPASYLQLQYLYKDSIDNFDIVCKTMHDYPILSDVFKYVDFKSIHGASIDKFKRVCQILHTYTINTTHLAREVETLATIVNRNGNLDVFERICRVTSGIIPHVDSLIRLGNLYRDDIDALEQVYDAIMSNNLPRTY